MVWYNLSCTGWVMKGLISIGTQVLAVSSPITMSSHCGDQFNKESRYGLIVLTAGTKKVAVVERWL